MNLDVGIKKFVEVRGITLDGDLIKCLVDLGENAKKIDSYTTRIEDLLKEFMRDCAMDGVGSFSFSVNLGNDFVLSYSSEEDSVVAPVVSLPEVKPTEYKKPVEVIENKKEDIVVEKPKTETDSKEASKDDLENIKTKARLNTLQDFVKTYMPEYFEDINWELKTKKLRGIVYDLYVNRGKDLEGEKGVENVSKENTDGSEDFTMDDIEVDDNADFDSDDDSDLDMGEDFEDDFEEKPKKKTSKKVEVVEEDDDFSDEDFDAALDSLEGDDEEDFDDDFEEEKPKKKSKEVEEDFEDEIDIDSALDALEDEDMGDFDSDFDDEEFEDDDSNDNVRTDLEKQLPKFKNDRNLLKKLEMHQLLILADIIGLSKDAKGLDKIDVLKLIAKNIKK